MPDNCEQEGCRSLAKLEQEVKDIRERNGADHKEFRMEIQEIQRDRARQEAKLDNITGSITELKVETKGIATMLTPLTNKMDDVDKLNKDMEEIKAKPGKKWENISWQVVILVLAAVAALVFGKIGLS